MLWHARLGHILINKLKIVQLCTDSHPITPYIVCAKARQHKWPFTHSIIQNSAKFQLLRIDIWGLYQTPTYNKYIYFLTIVDDFSGTTWTHLLNTKSDAFTFIKSLVNLIEN